MQRQAQFCPRRKNTLPKSQRMRRGAKNSCQAKCFLLSPFYQKNKAPAILLPGEGLSRASRIKSLLSHRLRSILLTWRLAFAFRSAVSQIYFPDVPPLLSRRSEVHDRALPCTRLLSMRAVHEDASAPPDDAERVGPDMQTSGAPRHGNGRAR